MKNILFNLIIAVMITLAIMAISTDSADFLLYLLGIGFCAPIAANLKLP